MINTYKVYVEGGESARVVGEGIQQKILELDKKTRKVIRGKSSLTESLGRASTETGGWLSSSISSSTPTSARTSTRISISTSLSR